MYMGEHRMQRQVHLMEREREREREEKKRVGGWEGMASTINSKATEIQ